MRLMSAGCIISDPLIHVEFLMYKYEVINNQISNQFSNRQDFRVKFNKHERNLDIRRRRSRTQCQNFKYIDFT